MAGLDSGYGKWDEKFYEEYISGLERDAVEIVVEVPRLEPRKVPEAVRLRRERVRHLE